MQPIHALSPSFVEALHAAAPAPDRAERMGLYGWLVGAWEMDVFTPLPDGSTRQGRGEIHFGWVLEGRAIQDVWITPPRDERAAPDPAMANFYGTTIRVYDPGIDAWHILWIDPVKQIYRRMIGRADGAGILQEGTDDGGTPVRWRFREITASSFRWTAERRPDPSAEWQLQVEFRARRTRPAAS